MSIFLMSAASSLMPSLLIAADERASQESFRWNQNRRPAPWTDGQLWPNTRMMAGDTSAPLAPFGQDACLDSAWAQMPEEGGGATMKKIIGATKDSTGTPLGSCTVQGFLTATDQFVREMTSDSAGYYEFCSEFAGVPHYLVAYKTGAHDVTGATVNTLMPA